MYIYVYIDCKYMCIYMYIYVYHIAGKFGGGKVWRIVRNSPN